MNCHRGVGVANGLTGIGVGVGVGAGVDVGPNGTEVGLGAGAGAANTGVAVGCTAEMGFGVGVAMIMITVGPISGRVLEDAGCCGVDGGRVAVDGVISAVAPGCAMALAPGAQAAARMTMGRSSDEILNFMTGLRPGC